MIYRTCSNKNHSIEQKVFSKHSQSQVKGRDHQTQIAFERKQIKMFQLFLKEIQVKFCHTHIKIANIQK